MMFLTIKNKKWLKYEGAGKPYSDAPFFTMLPLITLINMTFNRELIETAIK